MTFQKQSLPSFASVISVLSIVFYCVGFFRVELQMNEQKERINALESVAEAKPPLNDQNMEIIKNFPGKSGFGKYISCSSKSRNKKFRIIRSLFLSLLTECR